MKKIIIGFLMLLNATSYCQSRFVRSEESKHKVTLLSKDLDSFYFDNRLYVVYKRSGMYKMKKDSITWIYGHNPFHFKDMVKVGFYDDFKKYVISIKTEKLP